ncbi:manganese-dependent inorganic pyrophosphatase [Halolactibacillus halophilus]|uniref:Probable manganese-dependent inorganic pyrophosphatase n=1 Tax=Halolactibacillus halophilus TaxID=306540 RepID=A0A1I5NF34_9BACI|nr:manganese-dependent inorganic pyrophosphatase [Halolactibacillus halophilus]GEM01302.1 putative manganese-dependent inorganic pyrophosphatase [Halolactibacillus halophilus]SFP20403.1 manganese-dependent inorganic pyrophosphatase [Halolactibacillus halophilus]
MSKTLIFGHKNPDTDTIASAISYAYLKQQIGADAEAVRLGEISKETAYALDYFNIDAPRLVETVSQEVDQVILVDHNEKQQSVSDITEVRVTEVIDHHRIANFETSDPLYYRAEPVGCTATILNKLFKEHDVSIPKNIAGLMLSAIVSDSLLFKSPTCTEEDIKAAKELEAIAGVDVNTYGLDMLKAGADLSDKSVNDLLTLDAKPFTMGDKHVEIAQVNTVDPSDLLAQKAAIKTAINQVIDASHLDLFVFIITDILTNDSTVIALGDVQDAVNTAFGVELMDDTAVLKGVVSRKKQVVPQLTAALA